LENTYKTYKSSISSIVLLIFFCGLGTVAGAFLIAFPYLLSIPLAYAKGYDVWCVLGGILIIFSLYELLTKIQFCVETSPQKIRIIGIFGAREFDKSEIEGYRTGTMRSGPVPRFYLKGTGRKISLNLNVQQRTEIQEWFEKNLNNLDNVDAQNELKEALSDDRLGSNEDEKRENLKKGQKIVAYLSVLGLAVTFWCMIWPHPYEVLYPVLILIPTIAIFLPLFFPGSIKFIVKLKTVYGTSFLIYPFAVPFLLIRATTDWKILDTQNFWMPFGISTFITLILLLLFSGNNQKDIKTFLTALVICAAYSAGTILSLNSLLDKSTPVTYPSVVIHKYSHTSRNTTDYYVTLSPWGPVTAAKEIEVNREVYNEQSTGASVEVSLKEGFFKIPWYSFEPKSQAEMIAEKWLSEHKK